MLILIGVAIFIIGVTFMAVSPTGDLYILGGGFLLVCIGIGIIFTVWFSDNAKRFSDWVERKLK